MAKTTGVTMRASPLLCKVDERAAAQRWVTHTAPVWCKCIENCGILPLPESAKMALCPCIHDKSLRVGHGCPERGKAPGLDTTCTIPPVIILLVNEREAVGDSRSDSGHGWASLSKAPTAAPAYSQDLKERRQQLHLRRLATEDSVILQLARQLHLRMICAVRSEQHLQPLLARIPAVAC